MQVDVYTNQQFNIVIPLKNLFYTFEVGNIGNGLCSYRSHSCEQ